MENAWVVRPYPNGDYRMQEFLDKNIVAIGWGDIGNIDKIETIEEIKEALKKPTIIFPRDH